MSRSFTLPTAVQDGDTAVAEDVNVVSNNVESAFSSLEAEFDNLSDTTQTQVDTAKRWAIGGGVSFDENTEVEPGLFASRYYATQSSNSASAASTSESNAATSEANAAVSEANAAASAASIFALDPAGTFSTVAALEAAMLAGSVTVGKIYDTLGYGSAGDGGGARYLIESGDTSEGFTTVHRVSGSYTAKYQHTNEINAAACGAISVLLFDDSAAVQGAVDYAESIIDINTAFRTSGVTVLLPYATRADTPITIAKSSISIQGRGNGSVFYGTLDIGDYTNTFRVRNARVKDLTIISNDYANTDTGITLYRTTNFLCDNVSLSDLYVGIKGIRSSNSVIKNGEIYTTNRTTNGKAGIWLIGTDESTFSQPNVYTPGGGMHVTDMEFILQNNTGGTYTEDAVLIESVDGFYMAQCHINPGRYAVRLAPQGTAESRVVIDVRIGANTYLDAPSSFAPAPEAFHVGGSVSSSVLLASGATAESLYEGMEITGSYLRGGGLYRNCIRVEVTDLDTWVADENHFLENICVTGGTLRYTTGAAVFVSGSQSGYVEPRGVRLNGVYFTKNNGSLTNLGSAVTSEADDLTVTGCVFGPDDVQSQYTIQQTLSSGDSDNPRLTVTGCNFSGASYTEAPINTSAVVGANVQIADNIHRGSGQSVKDRYKGSTTNRTPVIIWKQVVNSSGQVGRLNVRTVGSSSDGSSYALYDNRLGFHRPAAGSTTIVGAATIAGAKSGDFDGIPVTYSVLDGDAWTASTAVSNGDLIKDSGNLYIVISAGTTGTTAPSHLSGVTTNGTATLGYVSSVASNTLAAIVYGPTGTPIDWQADIDLVMVP